MTVKRFNIYAERDDSGFFLYHWADTCLSDIKIQPSHLDKDDDFGSINETGKLRVIASHCKTWRINV